MELIQNSQVQDAFITELKERKTPCTIYITNGFQVRGVIVDDDETSIIVQENGERKLVYKHAISTIAPSKNERVY